MEQINSKTGKAALILLLAGGFMAALKFGSIAITPEVSAIYPETLFEYLFISFPAHSFGLLSGVLLILSSFAFFDKVNFKAPGAVVILLLSLLLPVAGLAGCHGKNTTFFDIYYLNHYFAAGAFALSGFLIFSAAPKTKRLFFLAVAAGVLIISLAGLYQYFIGFAETKKFVISEAGGEENIPPVLLARLNDSRVYATMTNANILAGFLLLTMPLYYFCAGELFSKIAKGKKLLALPATLILVVPAVAVFFMTKSRGAFFAAALTGIVFIFDDLKKKSLRIAAVIVIVGAIIGGAIYIQAAGRGFTSLAERVDYCRTALKISLDAPFSGCGWGNFQRLHMKMKLSSSDEAAKDPHNIVLAYLSMCGIPAGIAAAAALLLIVCQLFKMRRKQPENPAIFYGVLAFLIHCAIEINHLVPGSWALFGALASAALCEKIDNTAAPIRGKALLQFAALLLGVGIFASSAKIVKTDYDFARCQKDLTIEFIRCGTLENLNNLLREYPDNPVFAEYAGRVFFHCQDTVNAEKHLRRALDLYGESAGIYFLLAEVEYRRGDRASGDADLRKAQELFPAKYRNYSPHKFNRQ